MKIVCDNCATKYSIADEKVRGKVFKIRCKKCSHIIVVRGNEEGATRAEGFGDDGETRAVPDRASLEAATAAPAATPEASGEGDGVWHLVVGGEQVGPFTPDEVRAKHAAGECDVETYAWRDGFSDWMRLGSIEDFADLEQARAVFGGHTGRT